MGTSGSAGGGGATSGVVGWARAAGAGFVRLVLAGRRVVCAALGVGVCASVLAPAPPNSASRVL